MDVRVKSLKILTEEINNLEFQLQSAKDIDDAYIQ